MSVATGPLAFDLVVAYIATLKAEQFYGEVRIKFERGDVARVIVEQHYLPATLPEVKM